MKNKTTNKIFSPKFLIVFWFILIPIFLMKI